MILILLEGVIILAEVEQAFVQAPLLAVCGSVGIVAGIWFSFAGLGREHRLARIVFTVLLSCALIGYMADLICQHLGIQVMNC